MASKASARLSKSECAEASSQPSSGVGEALTVDEALSRIDAEGHWPELESKRSASPTKFISLSPPLGHIVRAVVWRQNRRIATSWFAGVTLILWLSLAFDMLILEWANLTLLLSERVMVSVSFLMAFHAWRRPERQIAQGFTACVFVCSVMLAAILTGHEAGGANLERFVTVGFFGLATGIALLPMNAVATALTMVVLNAIFFASQIANSAVDNVSGLMFTLYCSAISCALLWMRVMTNIRQIRATMLRLFEARGHRLLKDSHDRLKVMAYTDELTGLSNRKAITEEFARLLRDGAVGTTLVVAMIDIDDFKKLNDTLGHAAGDGTLRSIGSLLDAFSRSHGATCGRIGGEEFILLCPGITMEAARAAIESMMADLAALNLPNPGSRVSDRVTISVGIVAATIGATPPPSMEALMRDADLMLYEAKNAGRNRIVVASAAELGAVA